MNETLDTINKLRTIHGNFSDKEINTRDLQTILDAAIRAANASARQSYSVIVVEDRKIMKKLCGFSGNRLLLFCVDFTRIADMASYLNNEFKVADIVDFVTGSTDTILAAQTAAITAKSLGIDSLFTNGIHRGDAERVFDILELPQEYCFPLIALILGYPSEEPKYKKGRIKAGVIHYGKYSRLNSDEMQELVKEYDDPANHIGLYDNWEKGGFDHYLDWFYKKWIPPFEKRTDTQVFYKLLNRAGFLKPEETNGKD